MTTRMRVLAVSVLLFCGATFAFGQAAVKLAVLSVNGGSAITAGTPFSVVVEAEDIAGTPNTLDFPTTITLSLGSGTGTLGGTVSGSIPFGGSQVTISGVTYTKAETGITLTATASGGQTLDPATSASFSANPGAPATISIVSGNNQTGTVATLLASALVVVVRDANANPVPGTTVTFSLVAPVNGATLGSPTPTTDATGQASTTLTLGTKAGSAVNLVSASATGTGSVQFSESATAGPAAVVQVETKSDGTGVVVPAADVTSGSSVTMYSITRDAQGNFIANVTADGWTYSTSSGGVVSGDLVPGSPAKSATFTGHVIGTAQIQAASGVLPKVPSGLQTVKAGNATKVRVETKADGTGLLAGGTVLAGDSLHVFAITRDASDNFVANAASSGWSLQNKTSGVVDADLVPDPDSKGAWFKGHATGSAAIQALSGGLTVVPSGTITVSVGAAARLSFGVEPVATPAGRALKGASSQLVTVRVLDGAGNLVTGDTRNITLAFGANPGGGTLGGTKTKAAVGGVATFDTVTVDKVASGYTLIASSAPALITDTTSAFAITPGAHTTFLVEAAGGGNIGAQVAGVPFAIRLTAKDAFANTVTTFTGTADITSTGTLSRGAGTTPAFTAGVLAVDSVAISNSGSFTITATRTGGTEAGASNSFNVAAGNASRLAFVQLPSTTTAGSIFAPAIVIQVRDANGNNVPVAGKEIRVSIDSIAGSGTHVLQGDTVHTTSGTGAASFSSLSILKAGTYVLRARGDSTLLPITSPSFVINPAAASKLAFVTQPGGASAGHSFSTQPVVALEDPYDNIVTGVAQTVTASIQTNPGAGTLSGTKTVSVNTTTGRATFSNLSIDKADSGYVLTVVGSTVSMVPGAVVSSAFIVQPGSPRKLIFTKQPSDVKAGATMAEVKVALQDSLGNLVPQTGTQINLVMDSTGRLGGILPQATNAGVATFNDLVIDTAGTKVIRAVSGALTPAVSTPFVVTPGPATSLIYDVAPGNGTAGAPLSRQPVLTLKDQYGNTVTGTAQTVTIALADTATKGAQLLGTKSVAVNTTTGKATFTNLAIDKAGSRYTLAASGSTVLVLPAYIKSDTFAITPGAPRKVLVEYRADGSSPALGLTQNVSSGRPVSLYAVSRDTLGNYIGNVAADSWAMIDTAGGIQAGDLVVAADRKSATFTGSRTGSRARVRAVLAGLTPYPSDSLIVVTAGTPVRTVVETDSNGTGRIVPAQILMSGRSIRVYAVQRDAANNFVGNLPADSWQLQPAIGGVAQADLAASPDRKSALLTGRLVGKALIAALNTGLTSVKSDTITISNGPAAFIDSVAGTPQSTSVTRPFLLPLRAFVKDSAGNPVRGVTVSFLAPVAGATSVFRSGRSTATTDSLGIAISDTLSANTVAGVYTDTAFVTGITSRGLFHLTNTPGGPKTLVLVSGSGQIAQVGTPFGLPFTVAVRDTFGNPVPGVIVKFTPPTSGPSGTFLGGKDTATTNQSGVAVSVLFSAGLSAGPYAVVASVAGVTSTASYSLTNTAGAAGSITAAAGAGQSAVVGTAFAQPLQALVKDQANNPVPGVLVRFVAPSTGASALFGEVRVDSARTNASGIAMSGAFAADTIAGTYAIVAAVDSFGLSTTFQATNLAGVVDTFKVEAVGGGAILGQTALVPFAIKVTAFDRYGNVARGFTGTVGVSSTGTLVHGSGVTPSFVAGVLDSLSLTFATASSTTPFTITVTRTGGTESGQVSGVAVVNPLPQLSDINPSNGRAGQLLDVIIDGFGFISGVTTASFGDGILVQQTRVQSATQLKLTIRIDSAAILGSRDIAVWNMGPGGGAAFLVNGFTVGNNPIPTLSSVLPIGGAQNDTIPLVVRGSNFLGGGTTSLSMSGTGVTFVSMRVDSTNKITARLAIAVDAKIGVRTLFVVNAPPGGGMDSLPASFTITSGNPPGAPTLGLPLNGAKYQSLSPTLSWQSVPNATTYHVQVSTSSAFATLEVNDSSITTLSKQVGPLTTYGNHYWRVRGRNAGSGAAGPWSNPWVFSTLPVYPDKLSLSANVAFPTLTNPSDYQATDYELIGLPGASNVKVNTLMGTGTAGTDWQVYMDNGASSGNPFEVFDGSARFSFTVGKGFWLIKKGAWTVNVMVDSAPLDSVTSTVKVPLQRGWNILTDPFTARVLWSSIQPLNGISEPIWVYKVVDGRKQFVQTDSLAPYQAYYFMNSLSTPRDTLLIPYSSSLPKLSKPMERVAVAADSNAWSLQVELNAADWVDRSTAIGMRTGALAGRDANDYHKPRTMFGVPGIVLLRPEWDAEFSSFATDFRPVSTSLTEWPLTVSWQGVHARSVEVDFAGVDQIPPSLKVYVIDPQGSRYQDLRTNPRMILPVSGAGTTLTVLTGQGEELERRLSGVLPQKFLLERNYPNPFNPTTTIPVSVPRVAAVRLVVYDITGREVRTLQDGMLEPGRHLFSWDATTNSGSRVATGIYFLRMTTGGGPAFTTKMLLMK